MSELNKLSPQLYHKGADADSSPEYVASKEGQYIDANNMRRTSVRGFGKALEKINGEEVIYSTYEKYADSDPNHETVSLVGYENIAYTEIKGHIFAIFAHKDPTNNLPCITIDDKLVCMSENLGLTVEYPCQTDINDSCVGGEVFVTDFNITPYIFNIQDMLDAWDDGSDIYFSGFNPLIYTINLEKQNDQPVFEYLDDLGPGNGLDMGMYMYAIRQRSAAGDTTQIGTFTPLIPVVFNYDDATNDNFPNHLTRGADHMTNTDVVRKYGIKLRFRITNIAGYNQIDIIRVKWNTSDPYPTVPSAEYHTLGYDVSDGEVSVYTDFTDKVGIEWMTFAPSEETQVLTSIQAAKGIRYYDNRLVLMNIKYASKDLSDVNIEFPDVNGENIFPYIHNMGTRGHADPKNTTYYRGNRGGERAGYAVLCKDNNSERTFALPIEDFITGDTSYQFPNNRAKLSTNSKLLSVDNGKGAVYCATLNSHDNDDIAHTHEIINLQARGASLDSNGNIIKPAYSPKSKVYDPNMPEITIYKDNWNPFHPIYQDDTNKQGHNKTVIDQVILETYVSGTPKATASPYSYVFAPELYSKGLAITGVRNLPSWVKSFSIVKTKPADRVICQGIGVYSFASIWGANKETKKIWFYSKEIDELGVDITGATQLQLVSPLGFNTEVYNAFKNANEDRGIDMISYARLAYNSSGSFPTNIGLFRNGANPVTYHTEHGAWRNVDPIANNPFKDGTIVNGDKIFTIAANGINQIKFPDPDSRYGFYEIEVTEDIYKYIAGGPTLGGDVNGTATQEYHEPFYIVNIINNTAEIPENNMTTYYETGHHQKIDSIIGVGTNTPSEYQLCDERYDDCIPCEYSINRDIIHSFIYLRDKSTGEEQRWLNITHKSTATKDTIIAALNANGTYTIPAGSLNPNPYGSTQATVITGVYTSDWNIASNEDGRDAKIIFGNIFNSSGVALNQDYSIPDSNKYIVVKYDDRFPLKVFGGDTIISEDSTCFVDFKLDNSGDGDSLYWDRPFPYLGIKFDNSKYIRIKNANNTNTFQSEDTYLLHYVRQWAVNFFHETRIHMPYGFNDDGGGTYHYHRRFPRTHYIMRPEKWDTSPISNNFYGYGGFINEEYRAYMNYCDEAETYWGYGGFICNNLSQFNQELGDYYNIDYNKTNNYLPATSKPVVGWEEQTDFCTQITWSERRDISQQNVPNLKTFLASSKYDIEDANGEIKRAFNAETSKGDNLYAFTENGVALLLTGKEMTQDANGDTIAYVRTGGELVNGRIWLREDCGMNREMWRSAAEWNKSIIWANDESAYMMFDNKINDIGRIGYYNRLYNDGLANVKDNYDSRVSAVYDRKHNEYWLTLGFKPKSIGLNDLIPSTVNYYWLNNVPTGSMSYAVSNNDWLEITEVDALNSKVVLPIDFSADEQITITNGVNQDIQIIDYNNGLLDTLGVGSTATYSYVGGLWTINTEPVLSKTFVFSIENDNMAWVGTFDYNFENMVVVDGIVYGVRDGETYELGQGYIINGDTLEANVTSVCNAEVLNDKEFIAIMVSAKNKPTKIEFANDLANLPECSLYENMSVPPNTYYLKNYTGSSGSGRWSNKIPRKTSLPNNRVQGSVLVFDVQHNALEPFIVFNSLINYKPIRLQI